MSRGHLTPRLARAVNRAALPFVGRLTLTVPGLMQEAEARAGLSDWGEDRPDATLRILLGSVEGDVHPHPLGRLLIREQLVGVLSTRLRLVEARKTRQAALSQPVRSPLIIAAMPRTGTTLLHRLLCQDPDAAWLPLWAAMDPLPEPSAREWAAGGLRLWKARLGSAALRRLLPDVHRKHDSLAHEPEECVWLFMPTLLSLQFWALWPVERYAEWAAKADPAPAYRDYRALLQLLQRTHPGRYWVLKSPMHFLNLDALLEAVPNARVVLIHRDPKETLPSLHSLFATTQSLTTDHYDARASRALTTRILAERAEGVVAIRDGEHHDRILDVDYRRLAADPMGVAHEVRAFAGRPASRAFTERAERWLAAHPRHRHGRHDYSLEQYELSPAQVDEAFASYRTRFGLDRGRLEP